MKFITGKLEHNGTMAHNLDICTLLYHPEQRKVSPVTLPLNYFRITRTSPCRQSFFVSCSIFLEKDST